MSSKKLLSLFLLKFLPIFFSTWFVIFSQSISAKEDLRLKNLYPHNVFLENKEVEKSFFTKKDIKYINHKDFVKYLEKYQKSEYKNLINLQKSTTLKKRGDCKKDKVSELIVSKIGDKGGELLTDFIIKYQSGIALFYSRSGIMQKEATLYRGLKGVKINDDVELCVMDVPEYCPVGDERGKTYKATNLRTGEEWVLVGSIKGCGEDFSRVKSIDCNKAQKNDEKIICSNPELQFLDEMLADEYQNFLSVKKIGIAEKSLKEAKASQLSWLKERSLCDNSKCIKNLYQKRLDFFDQFLFRTPNLEFLGTCAKAGISGIRTSFDARATYVYYNSNISGTSYGDVAELSDSKIRDIVVLCVTELPGKYCPTYYQRAISLKTYNLRTKKSWISLNSAYDCVGS
jgi:uncharacterized protein